ncbi:TadE family protein [Photobacterium sanguinicancri]|uniref:TadE family protein n=1 Tax=Photobacterium sanguinicancri TaxID=875932 RepID=UPI0021C41CD1|nr:TadE family protein [Photobacterium sanguinicancri]
MKKIRGSISVEVALGLPVLILTVFAWFDLCVMSYAFAVSDHALNVATSETKKLGKVGGGTAEDYEGYVESALATSSGILFPLVVKADSVKTDVHYFKNIDSLSTCSDKYKNIDDCPGVNKKPKNMAIAIYSLSFQYKPVFSYFLEPMNIKREVIAIQEYERCKFKVGPGDHCE